MSDPPSRAPTYAHARSDLSKRDPHSLILPSSGATHHSQEERGISGAQTDGVSERGRLEVLGRRILPPFPGPDLIPVPQVPPAPTLDPRATTREWVVMIATVYRNVLRARYQLHSNFMRWGNIERSAGYSVLVKFAEVMASMKIAPASWMLFSCDVWGMTQKGAPKAAFVHSINRLETRREWYDEEKDRYAGGRTMYDPGHLELLRDWQRMWMELLLVRPMTRDELSAVVERYFPGQSYEGRLTKVQVAAKSLQVLLNRRVAAGEILW